MPKMNHTTDFDAFFSSATGLSGAYPYQRELATDTSLPELLSVPTGVGKTAATILGWLWRRRFHVDAGIRDATPRRLVYCLPMRTLVEQTRDVARGWLTNLGLEKEIAVHLLMGGEDASDWDAYPERDAILIGTQDMLLSRALNRGYGMSRYRWPMHFGLLNNDCLWVMDETQLMGVGLTTSAQLQGLRDKLSTYGVSHTLWMSATLDAKPITTVDHPRPKQDFSRLGLTDADKRYQPVSQRLISVKALEQTKLVLNAESEKRNYAKELAATVRAAHREQTLTLVVMNRVARAQEVFSELQNLAKPKVKPSPLVAELALIHARFRPHDRRSHELTLFSKAMPAAGRIVVATQAIEAGVDISAATLFTELAPWASLVQRFGRCNRGGEFPEARVMWIDIVLKDDKDKTALPYEAAEFEQSHQLLATLDDVGPQSLETVCAEHPARVVHTLRRKDLLDLWDTTPDLAGNDIDVSRFIRDSEDTDVQFFWRDVLADQSFDLLPAAQRHELCSVSIGRARDFLDKLKKTDKQFALVWKPLEKEAKWQPIDPREVRPGMVLLLKPDMGGYLDAVGWTGDPSDKPTASLPTNGEPPEAMDDGRNLNASQWVSITQHLNDVALAAVGLQNTLATSGIAKIPWEAVITAARWHDVGKAHAAFQNMLLRRRTDSPDRRPTMWAKSDGSRMGRARYFADAAEKDERVGFRHELASAIAWLAHRGTQPDANLIAYLIAAHHGKVRGSIRSLPNEIPPADTSIRFARGLWHGDILPPVDLGNGEAMPATGLDLSLMELGESASGPSWLSRVLGLRDDKDLGPFRLSFLEMLLRVADWRGSSV